MDVGHKLFTLVLIYQFLHIIYTDWISVNISEVIVLERPQKRLVHPGTTKKICRLSCKQIYMLSHAGIQTDDQTFTEGKWMHTS